MASKFDRLKACAEDNVFFSRGTEHRWEGDALTGPDFVLELLALAAEAHESKVREFIEKWKD